MARPEKIRLGEVLIQQKLLTEEQLMQALAAQKSTGRKLGRVFVESGPGRVLTGLVGRILGRRPHAAIACDRAGEDSVFAFLVALGQLAVRGVPVRV